MKYMFKKILNKNILELKKINKHNLWIKHGNNFGIIYKNNKSHCLLQYIDMNNNKIYFDEVTNNIEYLKSIFDMSLIDENFIPIFELKEKIYRKKFT